MCTALTTTTPPVPPNLLMLLLKQQTQAVNDKGEITGTSKLIPRKLATDEMKSHSSWTVEGRTELDLAQDEVDGLPEEAHVEVQAAQNKATETASATSGGGNVPDQETDGGELRTSRSMRTGLTKR